MNNQLIRQTAKAWGLNYEQTKRIYKWVDNNVMDEYKFKALITLLKRKRAPKES